MIETDLLSGVIEKAFLGQMLLAMSPPDRMSSREWAEDRRVLSTEISPKPGRYDAMVTPYMLLPMQMLDDPTVPLVIARKSAQIAWTEVVNNLIGKRIDLDPCNILIAFPTRDAGVSYSMEKLKPFIKSTPELLSKIGNPDNLAWNRLKYPGGFLKLLTAGSITNLKSTNAALAIVEEPDDLKKDVAAQGDALVIFRERQKAHPDAKLIYGGTPANKGDSKVDAAYENSCKYEFQTVCHECEQSHHMDFKHLKCKPYGEHKYDKEFGEFNPATAHYVCPHCQAVWTDKQKNLNVLNSIKHHELGWKKMQPEAHDVGFAFNELMSPFAGSSFVLLAEKRAKAYVDYAIGDDNKLKSWINNSEGKAYSPPNEDLNIEFLAEQALTYPMGVVPKGGVYLTAGIDVQHNRFHIIVRAWGAQKNSWLVLRQEIFGNVLLYSDPVWAALAKVLLSTYPIEGFPTVKVGISAMSIDSSDGNTAELVYQFVQHMSLKGAKILAAKGGSETTKNIEIFTQPTNTLKSDGQKAKSLAETHGINVYIVGSNRAKETIYRKLRQTGSTDRMYYPQAVTPVYYDQLLSNIKKTLGARIKYELIVGRRDEDLDCEGLALHASRSIYLHLYSDTEFELAYGILTGQVSRVLADTSPQVKVTKGLNLQ